MKRLLPEWMTEQADAGIKYSESQRCKVPAKRFPRRVMYVLTPDELLATARIVLADNEEESRTRNTTEQEVSIQQSNDVRDCETAKRLKQTQSEGAESVEPARNKFASPSINEPDDAEILSPSSCFVNESICSSSIALPPTDSQVQSDLNLEERQDASVPNSRTGDCAQTFDYLSSIFFGDDSD